MPLHTFFNVVFRVQVKKEIKQTQKMYPKLFFLVHIIALKAFFSVCCLLLFSSCVHPNVSFRTAMKSRMHTTPHIQSTTPRSCLSVADWPSELYTLLRQIRLSRMYRTTGAKRREFLHLPRFVLLTRRARFYSRCPASSIWMSSIHPISQRF